MKTRTKISDCSVRVKLVAEPLGFKTLGTFYKFLKQCNPNARLYYGGGSSVDVSTVIRHVEKEN